MSDCLFLRDDKCTNNMCDTYMDFPSEHFCSKCPCKAQNDDLSEENKGNDKLCNNCSFYVKEGNFKNQCVWKGEKKPTDTCVKWRAK